MLDKEKVPAIRLKGFTDAWEQRKLGELVQFSKGSGYSKSDLIETGTPIILYGRLYTNYETVISNVDTFVDAKPGSVYSRGGEVIVPASGETSEDISIASVVEKMGFLLGGDLNVITPAQSIDPAFLAISISCGKPHEDMAKVAQGKSIVHLHNSDLEKIELLYPSHDEQLSISTYFRELDKLITLHQRKFEKLKNIKIAMIEKMFPKNGSNVPEIRFTGFTDAWKQHKLSEILVEYNERAEKNQGYEHVSLTKEGVVAKTERYDRDSLVTTDNKSYRITRVDDICYNPANLKFGVICRNRYKDAIFSPIYITFKVIEDFSPAFIEKLVTRETFIIQALKWQQGTVYERTSVSPHDLLRMQVLVPTIDEQIIIGRTLTNLDNLIILHQRKLEKMKNIKKACLEKMLV